MTQTVLLGDICTQITDGTHSTVIDTPNGSYFLLSAKNIKDKVVISDKERRIDAETLKFLRKRTKTSKDDILVTSVGTIGETAIIQDELPDYEFQRSVLILKPNTDVVIPRYLYYCMRSLKSDFISMATGAVQKCLFIGQMKNVAINLPSLEKQKKIADILGSIDEKIELNRKMNVTLEQMGQVLFRHYFIDNPASEKWINGKVGDVLSVLESGSRPKGGAVGSGIPSVGAENIEGLGKYDFTKEKYVSNEFYDSAKRGKIKSEDVLLYKDGAYVGKKSLFMDEYPHKKCMVNEHVFILRTSDKLKSQFYLYYWLDQPHITEEIITNGVKAAQPGLNQSGVNGLPILIPPADEIDMFDRTVRPIMNRIFTNSNEIKTLTTLRDSLLPRLISGKIKI